MAYNAILNSVYNHYLTTYAPKSTTQFDTHKKSELRGIYNSMVKLNKESPLFLLDTSAQTQEFAVGVKENARGLRNTIASLGGLDEAQILNKKIAYSDKEDIVSASYIGDGSEEETPSFSIEVKALASGQINTGALLPSDSPVNLAPNAYSFDVAINDLNYEFQFNIKENETNKDVQERLARLVNNSGIGLSADVSQDESGSSRLVISSVAEGKPSDKDYIFNISDDRTSKASGAASYFGLNQVSCAPKNAEFLLNGEERSTSSNNFTIANMYELHLNNVSSSEGESANIGMKTDVESLKENVTGLLNGFNDFLDSTSAYTESQPKSNRLLNEMSALIELYESRLEQLGISMAENGKLEISQDTFEKAALSEDSSSQLSSIKDFTNAILRKTNQVSLDPMNYVNRTVVEYKNPGKTFVSPYTASAYSGMMFNGYC